MLGIANFNIDLFTLFLFFCKYNNDLTIVGCRINMFMCIVEYCGIIYSCRKDNFGL